MSSISTSAPISISSFRSISNGIIPRSGSTERTRTNAQRTERRVAGPSSGRGGADPPRSPAAATAARSRPAAPRTAMSRRRPTTAASASAAPRATMSRSGKLKGRKGRVASHPHRHAQRKAGTGPDHAGSRIPEPRRVQITLGCRRCGRLRGRGGDPSLLLLLLLLLLLFIGRHGAAAAAGRAPIVAGRTGAIAGASCSSRSLADALGSRRSTAAGGYRYGLLHGCKMCQCVWVLFVGTMQ
mmetsp:Transcript_5813/g.12655  ORF Transcript_5813/g.12655 Transcript_5813/m.12655 type:complete len:241 (+) Transcript_5813:84-806(+)